MKMDYLRKVKFFLMSFFISVKEFFTHKKPHGISWSNFLYIIFRPVRYQTIEFSDGSKIKKKCDDNIVDSTAKLKKLKIKKYFNS
jgi:hypothetical protein